jgi:hypothetical protein
LENQSLINIFLTSQRFPIARNRLIHSLNDPGGAIAEFSLIDLCINNAIIDIEVRSPYAQTEGKRGSSGRPAQAGFGNA